MPILFQFCDDNDTDDSTTYKHDLINLYTKHNYTIYYIQLVDSHCRVINYFRADQMMAGDLDHSARQFYIQTYYKFPKDAKYNNRLVRLVPNIFS